MDWDPQPNKFERLPRQQEISAMALSIGFSGVQLTLLKNNQQANRFTNRATERLTTGLRLNRASDDPAGLIGAKQLRAIWSRSALKPKS
jgi:hypothetical protein